MSSKNSRPSSVVGVVVDGDVIRAVQLRNLFGRLRIVAAAEHVMTSPVSEQGRIVDGEALTVALKELWAIGGFRTKSVSFGLDGRDATFRRLLLPSEAGDSVHQTARFELDGLLAYDIEDAVTFVSEVDRSETGIDVTIAAARDTTIEAIADSAAAAGLRLCDVTLVPTSVGLAIGEAASPCGTIVSVDGSSTTIVVRRDGRANVTRVLSGGGGGHADRVADELEEALASVDQFRQGDSAAVGRHTDPRMRRFQTVVQEVAAAIHFEESQQESSGPPLTIELTGSCGADPALVELMTSGTHTSVSVAEAPHWWDEDAPFATFGSAAGVAMNTFGIGPDVVHLEVPSLVERAGRRREVVVGLVAACVVAVPALLATASARDSAVAAEDEAAAVAIQADLLAARVDSLATLDDLQGQVFEGRQVAAAAVEDEVWLPRVLDEIASTMPEATFLDALSLRRPSSEESPDAADATATFSGYALDQAGVAEWLLSIESLESIDHVWLIQSTAAVFGDDELPVVSFVGEGNLTTQLVTPRAASQQEDARP